MASGCLPHGRPLLSPSTRNWLSGLIWLWALSHEHDFNLLPKCGAWLVCCGLFKHHHLRGESLFLTYCFLALVIFDLPSCWDGFGDGCWLCWLLGMESDSFEFYKASRNCSNSAEASLLHPFMLSWFPFSLMMWSMSFATSVSPSRKRALHPQWPLESPDPQTIAWLWSHTRD